MIPLFKDDKVYTIDIIALQEPWRNQKDRTTYHPLKDRFDLVYIEDNKTRVCFYINKKIDLASWTYTHHSPDLCTLHLKTRSKQTIYLHNIYNPAPTPDNPLRNLFKLQNALDRHKDGEQIIVRDFNLHHPAWGGINLRKTNYEAEKLILMTSEKGLSQMLPKGMTTYKKSFLHIIIDLVFATPLLAESMIRCGTNRNFDHDSDRLSIIF